MSVDRSRSTPHLEHHDMDAPPWWRLKKKTRLYADGFAPKTHRVIMQFMLLPENDRDTVLGWEEDFRAILDWMESVEPPKYRGLIDPALAADGCVVFERHCAGCHGTYGASPSYPEKVVPIDVIGTDSLRLRALSREHREWMRDGWLSRFGMDRVDVDPKGYVAPPLDGIWASAPYLHNGSVPTLRELLSPSERPSVWRQSSKDYDHERVGVTVERLEAVPRVMSDAERRWYFDSALPGKGHQGHDFGDILTDTERNAVLEYLKTL
jgi:mono/diheme cytochrome c family protein